MKTHALVVAGLLAGGTLMAGPAPVADPKAVPAPVQEAPAKPRWWFSVGVDYMSARLDFERDSWNPDLKKPDIDTYLIELPEPRTRDVEVISTKWVLEERTSSRSDDDFDFGSREESWGPLVTLGYNFAQTAAGDFGISLSYTYHTFDISNKDTTGKAKYSQEVVSYYYETTEFPPDFDTFNVKDITLPEEALEWDSEKETYHYTRTETASFDVDLHSLPLLLNWTVGTRVADRALNLVLAVGPTFDFYNWDLYHKVEWKGDGGSKKRTDSGSGTEFRVGLLVKAGLQYSFDTQDRWFIEGAATYRAGKTFTAEAGDSEGRFNADGFGAQVSIGYRF